MGQRKRKQTRRHLASSGQTCDYYRPLVAGARSMLNYHPIAQRWPGFLTVVFCLGGSCHAVPVMSLFSAVDGRCRCHYNYYVLYCPRPTVAAELSSCCVKVEVDALGSTSLLVRKVSADREQH